ncbi:hypothetical protein LADH09A_002993 [Micromonospora sp. LAH09]|uniref:hypothetical protein n=1 Tax=Micromonospora cabrerizensis TaxID=2911213 RepID=UPI001EE7C818|nr:hypothetical protein [Micromonospora cabrerizensis]MCG5469088.1 hypothetical protein [Micromonospora cabrerizensis]
MGRGKNPWWQTTKTPKGGFILGGIWIFLGVARAVAAIGEPIGWSLIIGLLTALLGAAYLISALLLRRRQRSQADGG